jgi:lincosamide and streptogramin A transport system ATP-binding/permease protein
MSNIEISNLSFRYEDASDIIFNDLNLNLDSTWKLGLVGRNGRGKTTFLNLLRGKLQGTGEIESKLIFSYFPITVKNPENITLYELQDQASFEQWELERELNLMNTDPNLLWQPFDTLSGGEQTKVLLALSFTDRDAFPLIDEPTNHLDEESRMQVAQYLKKKHDKGFIASYEDTKEKRDQFNRDKNEKLKGEVKNLNKKYVRFNNWSDSVEAQKYKGMKEQHVLNRRTRLNKGAIGHVSAKMMKKAINTQRRMDKRIEEKKGLMVNIEDVPDLTMNFQSNYHHTLLETQHLSLRVQDKQLFEDLNMIVENKGVISLEGKNGTGKSTFFKLLLSKANDVSYQGQFALTNGLKISYLPQDFTEYTGTLKEFAEKQKISYEELLNNLKKMGFPRESFTTKIEEMSMGQQKRVALAKSLVEPVDLYLWDEPANYLDVFNQDQLIKLLKNVQPAMVLVEHDQYFIEHVATQRIKLEKSSK